MSATKPKYYITTPIYYVNARPHLGHTYTTLAADVIARYKQMRGYDVVFLTGTDEHGQKVERSAKKAEISPIDFVDRIAAEYFALWKELGFRVDRFIRTTETRHAHAVQHLFKEIQKNGYVEKGYYEGNYCVYDEMYMDDPAPGALCSECQRPTELVKEENYFFKLSAFEKPLLNYYRQHPEFIEPEARRNEVISFVSSGLRDLSISRTTLKWGIPWPGDEKHVFYVWSDALTNYITAVGYPAKKDEFERLWPADVHLVGKEIIRFHAVYWPAFLMAAGLPLPKKVFAHGHLLFQEEKMSKSRGNIQSAQPIARVLGTDALRYFLLREIVFGQDGNFSREALIARYNSDLANGLGNLASRTLAMIEKNFEGRVPEPAGETAAEERLAGEARAAIEETLQQYDAFGFSRGLETIWGLISAADRYLTSEQPWALGSTEEDQKRRATILWSSAELLRIVCQLAHPALPDSTARIWALLGQSSNVGAQDLDWLRWGELAPGTKIGKTETLFPRVEKTETIERIEAMENELQKPAAPVPASAPSSGAGVAAQPATDKISIEDFAKVEMRVGQVKTAERVQGADKLLKLAVDIGSEVRQIVAGIAQHYEPESLIGRKVVVVVNLAPRKLRGVESNGMIVAAAVGPEGRPVLAGFHEEAEVGARLR